MKLEAEVSLTIIDFNQLNESDWDCRIDFINLVF